MFLHVVRKRALVGGQGNIFSLKYGTSSLNNIELVPKFTICEIFK